MRKPCMPTHATSSTVLLRRSLLAHETSTEFMVFGSCSHLTTGEVAIKKSDVGEAILRWGVVDGHESYVAASPTVKQRVSTRNCVCTRSKHRVHCIRIVLSPHHCEVAIKKSDVGEAILRWAIVDGYEMHAPVSPRVKQRVSTRNYVFSKVAESYVMQSGQNSPLMAGFGFGFCLW